MRTTPNSDNRYYQHSLFGSRRDFLKLAAVAGSLPMLPNIVFTSICVDLNLTALETATSNSGVHGRFLYQPSNTAFPYAIYVIDKNNAVAIPVGGSNSETETLLRFIHQ
jgi:hypothetical protein